MPLEVISKVEFQCVQHYQCGKGSDWGLALGLALGLAGIGAVGLRFVYVIKSLVSTRIGHYTDLPMQNNIVGGHFCRNQEGMVLFLS